MGQGRAEGSRGLRNEIVEIVNNLPFDLVRTLWLVDVCDLAYAAVAKQTRRSEAVVAATVRDARTQIRAQLDHFRFAELAPGADVGSLSPDRLNSCGRSSADVGSLSPARLNSCGRSSAGFVTWRRHTGGAP